MATANVSMPVLYGNMYGGYTMSDKTWSTRVSGQVDLILSTGADLCFMVELHEETDASFAPQASGLRYFLAQMRLKDPDWEIGEGDGGNHLLYRPSKYNVPSVQSMTFAAGNRAYSDFTVQHNATGVIKRVVLTHFVANDSDGTDRTADRKLQASELASYANNNPIDFFLGDFNSATETAGNVRSIFKAAGWTGLREKGPVVNGTLGTNGAGDLWIEDIWSRPAQPISNSRLILTNGLSDHNGWLGTTFAYTVTVPDPVDPAVPDVPPVINTDPRPGSGVMRWSARLRDPDLRLLDEIEFSEMTLVRTYNAPSTLAINGRLDQIRKLLQPGYGLVVSNDDGQQFSGRLVQATRRGNGTATAMYVGDLVRLWDRICYPNTNLPWQSQISDRDIVTGSAEARILSLVNRNAGPGAWHSDITGTDPGEDTTFTQWKTIVPDMRTQFAETTAVDPVNGDIYMIQIQSTNNDIYINRLDTNGIRLATMTVQGGKKPERLILSSSGTGSKRKVYVTFRHGETSIAANNGTWVRLEYIAKTWKATQALAYQVKPPANLPNTPPRRPYLQGETSYGGYLFRLYGTSYANTGSIESPAIPAFVEVIRNGKIIRTVPAGHLGRDGANNPYDGRMVPAGLSVVTVAGQPSLLVGICTGNITDLPNATVAMRLYTLPLKPEERAAEDRRIPGLVMPVSQNRGPSSTTTVVPGSGSLGAQVAAMAELANLAISIEQVYTDGTPRLAFTISDTPDLSPYIRVGNADGPSPVVLGEEWLYTDALATITTGLARAGGPGSDRILRSQTSSLIEELWDVRVEGFLDNEGTTDLSEINDAILKALEDAAGPSEVAAPLGASELRWGVDIPLGARLAAVLDGQAVVERFRQLTFTVANRAGEPTTKTEATLGSPDSALKTPTQKQLAAMLRRLQRIEKQRTL